MLAAGDVVLRVFGPVSTHNTLKSTGASNAGYVSFTRTGTARFPDAAAIEADVHGRARRPATTNWYAQ